MISTTNHTRLSSTSPKISIRKTRQLLQQSKQRPSFNYYNITPLHSARQNNQTSFTDITKITFHPNHYSPDQYRFNNSKLKEEGGLCRCISDLENNNTEIYISPSQTIFRQQFKHDTQCSLCLTTKIHR